MNTPVPHITVEQASAIYGNSNALDAWKNTTNRLIDAYNEKQANEQYITAEEARKLVEAGGKAEWSHEVSRGHWYPCNGGEYSSHSPTTNEPIKYRALQAQPEPVASLKCGGGKEGSDYCSWCGGTMWMNVPEVCPVRARESLQREKAKREVLAFGCEDEVFGNQPCEKWCGFSGVCSVAFKEPVQSHAELKAMYEQQVKEGTTGFYLWEFQSDGFPKQTSTPDVPEFRAHATYTCTDISCYVSKDGEPAIRMLRTDAQKLQAELGDTVEWKHPNMWIPPNPESAFACEGIYTYKRKANLVKLDGELMTRESAIAKWESKKDAYGAWFKSPIGIWVAQVGNDCNFLWPAKDGEYELRKKPAQPKVHLTVEGEQPQEVTQAEAQAIWEGLKPTHEIYYRHSQLLWDKLVDNIFSLPANRNLQYELRLKPQVKLTIDDNPAKMLTPAQCNAETLARIDTHDLQFKSDSCVIKDWLASDPFWFAVGNDNSEYRLIRKQPKLIPLDWKDVPVGVAVRDKKTGVIWVYMGSSELEAVLVNVPSRPFGSRFIELADLELAPASEQPWFNWRGGDCPVPEGVIVDITLRNGKSKTVSIDELDWRHSVDQTDIIEYRITGLAEGYGYGVRYEP